MANTFNAITTGTGGISTTGDSTGAFSFTKDGGSAEVYIDASGNVGVGTSSPGALLDVRGTTRLGTAANTDTDSALITSGAMTVANSATQAYKFQMEIDASTSYFSFNRYYSGGWNLYDSGLASSYFVSSNNNLNSYFAWGTANTNTATPTERMRLTANGGVAFGGASNYGTSGQVLQSNGDAAPTWVAGGSMTLLGTLTTTSGTSQSLTGLTLTSYKVLYIGFNGVSGTNTSTIITVGGTTIAAIATAASSYYGYNFNSSWIYGKNVCFDVSF